MLLPVNCVTSLFIIYAWNRSWCKGGCKVGKKGLRWLQLGFALNTSYIWFISHASMHAGRLVRWLRFGHAAVRLGVSFWRKFYRFDGLLRSFTRYRGIYGRLRAFTGFRGHGFGHDVVTGLGGSPVPVIGMLLRVWLVVYGYGFPSFQTDPLFFFLRVPRYRLSRNVTGSPAAGSCGLLLRVLEVYRWGRVNLPSTPIFRYGLQFF